MTPDREHLEFAAKAAGLQFDPTVQHKAGLLVVSTNASCQSDQVLWNPLVDDGDEARLEATLILDVRWWPDSVLVINRSGTAEASAYYADHNGDRQAARRAAGVRCAARIGRKM